MKYLFRQFFAIFFPSYLQSNYSIFSRSPSVNTSYLILLKSLLTDKRLRKKNLTFCVRELFTDYRAVYEIMWKKYGRAGQATDGNIIHCMRIIYLIPKTIIFGKWEGVVGTGWSWLRIGTGGGRLWVR